jgi:subtilisin family serine protease
MTEKMTHALLVTMLAGALVAGCGGGDSPTPAPAAETPAAAAPAADASPASVEPLPASGESQAGVEPTPQELAALDAAAAAAAPVEKQIVAAPADRRVPGQYIVTLREDAGATGKSIDEKADRSLKRAGGGIVRERFTKAIQGYSATMTEAAAQALLADPEVEGIEEDQLVTIGAVVQNGATWGLDRIDQRTLPLSSTYRYEGVAGTVTAYILDTGIRATHAEFRSAPGAATSRVRPDLGFSAIADGRKTDDCNGHGTHVSGTVGGLTYGVAKQVTLAPVRVLDCNGGGTLSGVMAGLDFVARNARKPAVANLSLGGGASTALDTAVANVVAAGVPVIVAAGNSAVDACTVSPARAPTAIAVGASTSADARAGFSNWGRCLSLFAPGEAITSSVMSSDTATALYSGTSMAAPHVTGVAAIVLGATPTLTPAQVAERIKALASPNVVSGAGPGSPTTQLFSYPGAEQAVPAPVKVSVRALGAGSKAVDANWWTSTVTIAVKNASGAAVSGAQVSGRFSIGGAPLDCTTGSTGTCTVGTLRLSRNRSPITVFTVAGISGTGMVHDTATVAPRQILIVRP